MDTHLTKEEAEKLKAQFRVMQAEFPPIGADVAQAAIEVSHAMHENDAYWKEQLARLKFENKILWRAVLVLVFVAGWAIGDAYIWLT